jgi:hypothetical protein
MCVRLKLLRIGSNVDCCEHDSESSGFMKTENSLNSERSGVL